MRLSVVLVIGLNDQQTGILARCARSGLQRRCRKSRDNGEVFFQLGNQFQISGSLLLRCKRMGGGKFGETHGKHLRCGVQFHGT